MDLHELLNNTLSPFNVVVSDEQFAKFSKYAELLKEWNEKINLTAITDDEGIIVKHFADSLTVSNDIEKLHGTLLADVGTGAGFPGIPLKIMHPEIKLILIDSLEKRLNFLREVVSCLELKNVEFVHARAEDAGRDQKLRDQVDIVVARAVAAMPTLLEYCMPIVKPGGTFLALKGTKDDGDFSRAMRELSTKLENKRSFDLVSNDETAGRNIYVFKKVDKTKPFYPRKAGTPKDKPL